MLHLVDDEAARAEGFVAMRGTGSDPDGEIADGEVAEAVDAGNVRDAEALAGFGQDALALAQRERLERFVLEVLDLTAIVEVAYPALECGVTAGCRIGERRARSSRVDAPGREPESGHGMPVSRRPPAE